ncbi:MAG: S-adenosylmethionine decarboxylase [Candidatus Andersenbacteria bacterium]
MKAWGKSIAIDLYQCDHKKMIDPEGLKTFIAELIKSVDMVAHGPCYVERFGEGKLLGYSAMQFIETSAITVHLDEVDSRAFIDLFSCKQFDAKKPTELAIKYFGAKQHKLTELNR